MRTKQVVLMLSLVLLVGCVGISQMTPAQRSLTFCNDFMTQYEQLDAQSRVILLDETVKVETKVMVATKVNPKLNKLRGAIINYCNMAVTGRGGDATLITMLVTEITTLLAETK